MDVSQGPGAGAGPRRHLVTVALEDYFHVGAFNQLIQRGEWYRFESRLEHGLRRTLDLLDAHDVKATFFALGWIADTMPELLREVAQRGHEVSSKGYYHRDVTRMSPEEFREDLGRAREALRRATGQAILGYRVADRWFQQQDRWALDVLADEGYAYDSSTAPMSGTLNGERWRRFAHQHRFGDRTLWEFPISSLDVLGVTFPIGGGNYFRQLPPWLVRYGAERWTRHVDAPFVLYFHTWELDPDQPRISAASFTQRVRHYRNLREMESRLAWFLARWRFTSVAEHLGLSTVGERPASTPIRTPTRALPVQLAARAADPPPDASARIPVSIVVPCHNEELVLPYLANTLRSVEQRLSAYRFSYVFVDDGSTDATAESLRRLFAGRPDTQVVSLRPNVGVAAAIMHGIGLTTTEIICSIDCDCTYDPHELGNMIPLLRDDVALVTASPYHAAGRVRNVPQWRLFLSRNLSWLYRRVLRNKLATYTSCFRVYRRSVVAPQRLQRSGFLGVTELLCRLDVAGERVIEYPATLEVRMLGSSKIKVLRVIAGHLVLLAQLVGRKLSGRRVWPPAEESVAVTATRLTAVDAAHG